MKNHPRLRISQSLIKDWWDYKEQKLCGPLWEALWVSRIITYDDISDSEVMKCGSRFEYELTGALDYYGKVPEIPCTKAGKPIAKMQYLLDLIPIFIEVVAKYNIEEIKINEIWEYNAGEYDCTVRPDMWCLVDKVPAVIDIKTTGLLSSRSSKFEDYGWDLESLPYKHKLVIQPIHTKFMATEVKHIQDVPFYWLIFSNTGSGEVEFIEARVEQDRLLNHVNMLDTLYGEIMDEIDLGIAKYPSVSSCKECPLKGNCTSRALAPVTKSILIR